MSANDADPLDPPRDRLDRRAAQGGKALSRRLSRGADDVDASGRQGRPASRRTGRDRLLPDRADGGGRRPRALAGASLSLASRGLLTAGGRDLPRDAARPSRIRPTVMAAMPSALQFHPEVTRLTMHRWAVLGAHKFALKGAQHGSRHLEGQLVHDQQVRDWLGRFLESWLGLAAQNCRARRLKRSICIQAGKTILTSDA